MILLFATVFVLGKNIVTLNKIVQGYSITFNYLLED